MRAAGSVLIPFLILAPARVDAYTLNKTRSGALTRWFAPALVIELDPAARSQTLSESAARKALERAVGAWANLPESARIRLLVGPAPPAGEARATARVRFVSENWKFGAEMTAHADFVADEKTGEIGRASISINEQHFRFFVRGEKRSEDAAGAHDLQAVLTHEIGHLLGIGHSTEAGAVMLDESKPGDRGSFLPTDDDRAALAALYTRSFRQSPPRPTAAPTIITRTLPPDPLGKTPVPCSRSIEGGDHQVFVVGPCKEVNRKAKSRD